MKARRVLFCLRYGIGDLVMELPLLQGLRSFLPGARITALGAMPALQLLESDASVDELVSVQDFGFTHWGDQGTKEGRQLFRDYLSLQKFDLVIDPTHAVLGAGEVIRQYQCSILDGGDQFQNDALARGEDGVTAIKAAARAGWGLEIASRIIPGLPLSAAEHDLAAQFLHARTLTGRTVFGFSPVASSFLKRWSVERLALVADNLLADHFEAALLFCGPQHRIGNLLLGGMRNRHRVEMVAELPLRQVAALLANCRYFIGNDTGLLHLAAAVQVPVLGLFGPTSPAIYLPPAGPLGVAVAEPCPYRKTVSFGPSACLVAERCLLDGRGCIQKVETEQLLSLLRSSLSELTPEHGEAFQGQKKGGY